MWTVIAFALAFVLTLVDDEIPFKVTGIVAAVVPDERICSVTDGLSSML